MSGAWLISYIALWAIVLVQGAVIFLLLRQLGLMYLGTAQGVSRDGLNVSARAPTFTVNDLEGRAVSLEDFRGMPLLLVFGSPSCGPCRSLMPDLNVFAHDHHDALRVLFLSRGGVDETERFANEAGARVPVAVHPDETLLEKYKVRVSPFAFLIDGEGVVRAKGLANNRAHLDMLVDMARKEAPEAGHNGARAEQDALEAQESHR